MAQMLLARCRRWGRGNRWGAVRAAAVAAAGLSAALAAATPVAFRLVDQENELYYHLAASAGERLEVAGGTEITGSVHSNGEVDLQNDSRVVGDASAVGSVGGHGTVTGEVREGVEPVLLPALPAAEDLEASADRVVDGDQTFDDLTLDDVLFVRGQVRIRGDLNGQGTLIATRDIRLDGDDGRDAAASADGGPAERTARTFQLDAETRISLVSLEDIRFGKGRPFRGVLRAGRDIRLDKGQDLSGVLVADRRIHLDKDSRIDFFDFDTETPAITLEAPADGALVATALPEVRVSWIDDFSGVRLTSLVFEVDGVDRTTEAEVTPEGLTWTPSEPLTEGSHAIVVTLTDHSDNEAAPSFAFTVDTLPPEIVVTNPADGATVNTPELVVSGTVSDPAGVAEVTVNGAAAEVTAEAFRATVTLEPGANTLLVEAVDRAGNAGSVSLAVTLATDTTPPTISITAPPAGIFLSDGRPTIDVSFRDDDSGVDPASLTFTADGDPLAVDCDTGALGARCSPAAPLPEGPVELTASIRDQAGNLGQATVAFVIDTEGLEVTVTAPADGFITREDEIEVRGRTQPEAASVEVDGVPAALSGDSFTVTVPLREGTNMLVALATKANGRTSAASVQVTRDVAAPIVRISSPADGFVAVDGTVAVTGVVNDSVTGGVETRVAVNGTEVPVADGAFMLPDLPLVPGPNRVEAVAIDAAGNVGRHAITVRFEQPVGARIGIDAGNGQSGRVLESLPEPLVARVTDELGNPVAGRVVTFEVSRNSGTLRARTSDPPARRVQGVTDGSGRASVLLTLGDTAGEGNNRVRATGLGVAGVAEFCASGRSGEPDRIVTVGGGDQRGLVSHPLPIPLAAQVFDVDGNPVVGVAVTFRVVKGSGQLDGQVSLVRTTDTSGVARAAFTLGVDPGINNNVVSARFEGLSGLPATFTASGRAPGDPAATRFSGVVLDNGLTPIPQAEVSIAGTSLSTPTDEEGRFSLSGVPVGHIHLHVDPSGSPRPETFPPLAFETVTIAGQENTLGMPILLPAIDTENSKVVGGPEDVTLTMQGVEGLALTVFAGSVTFPDGSHTGRVSISQVQLDKVPMPPPNGTIFMAPTWTVQPHGTVFDPPARITIPNNGLPPGRVIDIFQFDHELNQFIAVGKGTVSEDGRTVTSDPGFGITRAGWGGGAPPPPPPTCTSNCDDRNECTDDRCENGACVHPRKPDPPQQVSDPDLCPERQQKPGTPGPPNGCGPAGGPDVVPENPTQLFGCLAGPSFTPPCNNHDNCYGTCRSVKGLCDLNFFADMSATCLTSIGCLLTPCLDGEECLEVCLRNAALYAAAVGIFGGSAYDSAQSESCICCPQ